MHLQGWYPTIVPSFHVCSKGEFSISPFKTVLGIVVTFFYSPSPFYPIDAVEKLCLELVRVGSLTKRRPWYFFVVFAKQLVSLATVFVSSRNVSQFVGDEHCVTRQKRLQGRLELGFIKVRSTLRVKP